MTPRCLLLALIFPGSILAESLILRQDSEILLDGVGQGANYTGTEDVKLSADLPTLNLNGASDHEVDGSPAKHTLLKFAEPFSTIPPFSHIAAASLFIDIDDVGSDMSLYRLNADATWDEAIATWDNFGATLSDGVSAADDAVGSPTLIDGLGDKVTVDVTVDVRAWFDGAINNGWAFLPGGSDGVDFDSSENADPTDRPTLTLTYYTPRELVLIQDETITIDGIGQGEAYTGTHDAELRKDAPDTAHDLGTGSSDPEFKVDDNNLADVSQVVLRFDDPFAPLPVDAVITRARLFIDIDNTGDDMSLYRLSGVSPWEESTVTWNNFGPSSSDGVLLGVETTGAAKVINGQGNKVFIDVTDDVLAWKNGSPNEGWVFMPGGSDGVDLDASENTDAADRPALLITYTSAIAEPGRITRGPYLQSGSPDRIILRWRTSRPGNSVVRYGTSLETLDQSVVVPGSREDHAVVIDALQSDTRYYYEVETTPTEGDPMSATSAIDQFFETAPAPGSLDKTTLWVIGDSGTGNSNADAVYEGFLGLFEAPELPHADVWLMLGDNAYNSGTDAEYQTAVFETYPELLANSVVWPTLGNHDAYTLGGTPYLDIFSLPTAGESGGIPSGSERYYSFDHANIHFVCLDSETSANVTDTPGSGGMYDWLETDLQACDKDWIIAFFHHGPYTKGSHDSDAESKHIQMRRHFLPLLEDYGVDLVMSGHSHQYERSRFITGHHGENSGSETFSPANIIDGGNGSELGTVDPAGVWIPDPMLGDGSYLKPLASANDGTVYAIAGASGKISNWDNGSSALVNPAPHPAHLVNLRLLGSLYIEIEGFTLNAKYIDDQGNVRDDFSISKGSEFHLSATPDELHEGGPASGIEVSRGSQFAFADETILTSSHPDLAVQLTDSLPFGSAETQQSLPLGLPADDLAEGEQNTTLQLATSRSVQPGSTPRRALLPGSTTTVEVTLHDSPSQAWYFANVGAGSIPSSDWLADGDGDGINRAFEAIFGGTEGANDQSLTPTLVTQPNAIELHFQRDTRITDLTPTPQHSATLESEDWSSTGLGLERVGPANPGGIELWKASMPYPFNTDESHFLRIAIQEFLEP